MTDPMTSTRETEELRYDGPIEPGMGFIWQPKLPYAREALVVREVRPDGDIMSVSQTAIGSPNMEASRSGSPAIRPDPAGTLNNEQHFRSSVVRCHLLDERSFAMTNTRAMGEAPKDGTMVRLLVDYAAGEHPLDDAVQAWTIGFNSFEDTGEDEWKFAGWCWSHDHFTQGAGTPIGWLPWSNPAVGGGVACAWL